MKDELVNSIVCMLDGMGVDTEGVADRLYILMKDYSITQMETALVPRDDAMNEQLLKRFLASKMVKGCTKRTIKLYATEIKKILLRFGKNCTQITSDDVRWELWQDSMTMFALSISTSVDGRFRDKREAMYMDIAHKYTKDEMQVFPQILGEICLQLEQNPEQDLLGDLYMQLDLGSHWHGQFFTPYSICEMMAEMQLGQQDYTIDNVKPITVCDCACGGGALLIAAAHEYRKAIAHTGLNAQHYICLYAQDLSQVSAMMCYVQLSLLGYAAKVKLGDSLMNPLVESDNGADIWYTPMWFSDVWTIRRLIGGMDKISVKTGQNI